MSEIAPESIPQEVRDAYFEMIKLGVKSRLIKDPNYPEWKGKGSVPNLD
jgi:hypothetical protein